ncbi:OmpR Response regulators consisting of a CheY-like receiver domain and a winged-helix DNA-binding domain [Candidatus Nanopelagicaceae bacterium]
MSKDPRSILVVDDNEDIRNLLSLVLQKEGYEVFLAPNGSEALEIIKNNRLDLILLDVMMPELSGLEVLSNIRGNKNNKISSIPVMMITAASTVSDIDAAIEIGASSYIIKPFRNENLIGKVSAIFQEELA